MIRTGNASILVAFWLLLCMCVGCSSSNGEHTAPPLVREVQDSESGTRLRVQTAQDTIGIADRIWIEAQWSWTSATSVSLGAPDWKAHDWTLVETIESPTTRTDDGYTDSIRWLIEPFLPGAYTVPSPVLLVDYTDTQREIRVDPMTVRVNGVLPDQDTAELNPVAAPAFPEQANGRVAPLWIGVIAVLVLLAVLVLWFVRGGEDTRETESVHSQLERIARDDQPDHEDAFEMLDRAFARLDPRLRETGEIADLIRECQRVRFANHHEVRVKPAHMARHALELLGHQPGRSHTGGVS